MVAVVAMVRFAGTRRPHMPNPQAPKTLQGPLGEDLYATSLLRTGFQRRLCWPR